MRLFLGLVVLVLAGCPCKPVNNNLETTSCEGACAHLTELNCEAAKPTPKGASCVEVCKNAESSGLALWGTGCVEKATSCEAADACGGTE